MSYVALVTSRFDAVARFYGDLLGFPIVEQWDRANARGRRFDTGGMRLEIVDNERKSVKRELGDPADRIQIVIEVDDIEDAREQAKVDTSAIEDTSWGARLFLIHDPDGVPVTFLQWTETE